MLLDQNNSPQMPLDKRIDLSAPSPALPPLQSITLTSDQIAAYADVPPSIRDFYHELVSIHTHSTAIKAASSALPAPKSLAQLLQTVPHISLSHPQADRTITSLLEPLDSQHSAPGYLTPDQIDDAIETTDIKLGLEQAASHTLLSASDPPIPNPSFGNTNSPYNWLRRHVPHIFLQDSEEHTSKPLNSSKPGALRGAGKRASIPAPSKPLADALEIVEEDGQGYEFALGGPIATKGKRKRDDEDPSGGYHPKTGRVDEQLKVKKPRARKSTAKVQLGTEEGASDGVAVTPAPAPKKRRPRVMKNQTPDVVS